MKSMAAQLADIRPQIVGKTEKGPEIVQANLSEGTVQVTTPVGTSTVALTVEDQREFIENSKELQRAMIRERKIGFWAQMAMLALTAATAAGTGYAVYKNTKNTGTAAPGTLGA
jgi:hypothetical protein